MIEKEIAEIEKSLEEISQRMGLPEVVRDAQELIRLDQQYRQAEALLKSLYEELENAATQNTGV